jgi:serine/threonine protein kinase
MSEPLRDRVAATLGQQYELESEIGRGGMSVVFRARDLRLNRLVAIKVLPPELAYDPAILTRFTREAQTSAQLSHPHIVPIYDVGSRDGIAYFVMGLIKGGNLAALLAREPRQPTGQVRRILAEVADALAYAHLHGVVHRDIKPDNILLDPDSGRAVVTDFGIARAVEAGTRLTLTGIAVGTPTYMSPEQATGEREMDGRSDIYSLGVVGYQMLTGRVPFSAGTSMALFFKHLTEAPRPIAELCPDAPRTLRTVVERALMKSPEERWPTAASFRDALLSDHTPAGPFDEQQSGGPGRTTPAPGDNRATAPRAPVHRYPTGSSPRRGSPAITPRQNLPAVPPTPGGIVPEPAHLAGLTTEQREDLRLWHGRIHLSDRIKAMRGYAVVTVAAAFAGLGGFVGGIAEGIPPFVLAPIVPAFMSIKLWRRGKSLRASGLRLRRVLLMPRARWVLPRERPGLHEQQLLQLAPREILDGRWGASIRRAVADRAAIQEISAALPKPDRALIPDLAPTVNALVDRVANLALAIHRLEQSVDPGQIDDLHARIAEVERDAKSTEGQRRLSFLRRQRDSLEQLGQRRVALAQQLENAGLALGNLRLDLIRLRSSGVRAALSDVTSATQEARALSREIDGALEAVAEIRNL